MALNPECVGRTYPPTVAYQVGREKVREFATAIGEHSPICHDVEAARAAGHPDLVAPPTFAFALTMRAMASTMADPELGLEYARVVHGEQRFRYRRPIVAGDELSVASTIADIAVKGRNEVLTTRSEILDSEGQVVAVTHEVLVSRGTAGDRR